MSACRSRSPAPERLPTQRLSSVAGAKPSIDRDLHLDPPASSLDRGDLHATASRRLCFVGLTLAIRAAVCNTAANPQIWLGRHGLWPCPQRRERPHQRSLHTLTDRLGLEPDRDDFHGATCSVLAFTDERGGRIECRKLGRHSPYRTTPRSASVVYPRGRPMSDGSPPLTPRASPRSSDARANGSAPVWRGSRPRFARSA